MGFFKQKKINRGYQIFKALQEKTRFRILQELHVQGELTTRDLVVVCDKTDASITNHLRTLRAIGLIQSRYDGKSQLYYYSLKYDNVASLINLSETANNIWENQQKQAQKK